MDGLQRRVALKAMHEHGRYNSYLQTLLLLLHRTVVVCRLCGGAPIGYPQPVLLQTGLHPGSRPDRCSGSKFIRRGQQEAKHRCAIRSEGRKARLPEYERHLHCRAFSTCDSSPVSEDQHRHPNPARDESYRERCWLAPARSRYAAASPTHEAGNVRGIRLRASPVIRRCYATATTAHRQISGGSF
jgi:hypothetical protein